MSCEQNTRQRRASWVEITNFLSKNKKKIAHERVREIFISALGRSRKHFEWVKCWSLMFGLAAAAAAVACWDIELLIELFLRCLVDSKSTKIVDVDDDGKSKWIPKSAHREKSMNFSFICWFVLKFNYTFILNVVFGRFSSMLRRNDDWKEKWRWSLR